MTLVSIQTVLINVTMACATHNSKTSSKHAKKLDSLGQRHINITRIAIGTKRIAENFNFCLLSFLFGVINVVDYFSCLYNFRKSLVTL